MLLPVQRISPDVQGVELLGDPRSPEPETFRISFPWGDVDVTRATDDIAPDYWVHVRVNLPGDGGDPEREFGQIKGTRVDAVGRTPEGFDPGDPNTYHVAVRVGPA